MPQSSHALSFISKILVIDFLKFTFSVGLLQGGKQVTCDLIPYRAAGLQCNKAPVVQPLQWPCTHYEQQETDAKAQTVSEEIELFRMPLLERSSDVLQVQ